jgi:hypothetical protein
MNKTDAEPQGDAFPFGYTPGSEEHAAVRHLRNSSNYLAPGGLLDKIRIPMVVLRGTLINLFMFLPVLIFAVLATEIVYIFGHYGNIRSFYKLVPLLSILFFCFRSSDIPLSCAAGKARAPGTGPRETPMGVNSAVICSFD